MTISRFTTYRQGGYQPGLPDSNVEAQGWRCGCGATDTGDPPDRCPVCDGPATEQEPEA